ncbi:glutathione S-transferase family protein [Novosphingobium sp. KN65.2]|uniref:glutathione S-transferase family protein n=1 Tax=Novosphingobium sp. KN65.2 TaxID=1478134 RepID=UPI0005E0C0CC|nr:glutathione S-transferase family protein [Novosphingobium sp. KN65.2]CDO38100.1 Glutathione S-transferase-like protein [Novosphingobium sp. KN65.2]
MAMVLYHGAPNGPSLIVLAALAETGVDVERRPIDLLAGERHVLPGIGEAVALDMGIEGEGPVLVVDGEAMTDAVFLAQYFDELSDKASLQPIDPYAHWEMMMWCRQITERLSPAAALLGNVEFSQETLGAVSDERFEELAGRIVSADLRSRWEILRDGAVDLAQIVDSRTKVLQAVERCEKQLGDGRKWLMGELTIADLATFAWLAGMERVLPESFRDKPLTTVWLQRVRSRPAVASVLADGGADVATFWAPGPEINRWG